jgi:hypothetical protein
MQQTSRAETNALGFLNSSEKGLITIDLNDADC